MGATSSGERLFVLRQTKNHLPQNGFTGWIKTGTNAWERVERQEEKSVFSSIWRPESVVIRVSFCHDNPV